MRKTCAMLGAAVMGLTGCHAEPVSGPSAPPPVSPPAAASPLKVILENFVGDRLDDVENALDQLKLKHEAVSGDGKKVLVASNWTVTDQDPAAGTEVKTGSTVRLTVAEAASPHSAPMSNPSSRGDVRRGRGVGSTGTAEPASRGRVFGQGHALHLLSMGNLVEVLLVLAPALAWISLPSS